MKYPRDKYVAMTVPADSIKVGDYLFGNKGYDECINNIRFEDDDTENKIFADVAMPNRKPRYVFEVSMGYGDKDVGYIWPVEPHEMIQILRFSLKDLLNEI